MSTRETMQQNEFANGRLLPMILKYSIPAAISLLVTAVYNIVDRIFVGNYGGTSALAGLSICFPLSFMMMAFGLTCSAGGASLFSLYAGGGDQKRMNRSFGNAFILVVVFEALLMAVLVIFREPLLVFFGSTDTAYEYASSYYQIVVLGCILQGVTQVCMDFIRVSGKPLLGMSVTGVGAVTNIILDAVFVIGFRWGVTGAALATVIGQLLSAILGAVIVFTGHTKVEIKKDTFKADVPMMKEIVTCGFAFWIAQMMMGLISLVYNGQLGKYGGDIAISVYAVVASIMTFVIMPASGISQGIQPILGNNYGAKNYGRVMETMKLASLVSVGVTCVIWLLVMFFPKPILSLFGATEDMYAIGVSGLRYNFCITPVLGFVMLATTFFQSINQPAPSIIITLLRQVVFLIPFIFLFGILWGTNGIFLAQPVSDGLAFVLSLYLVMRTNRKLNGRNKTAENEPQ